MDADQLARLNDWLQNKWKHGECEVCTANAWQVTGDIAELRPYSGAGLVIGPSVVPVFMVHCTNCGHELVINALVAGVLNPPAPSPAPAGQDQVGVDDAATATAATSDEPAKADPQ